MRQRISVERLGAYLMEKRIPGFVNEDLRVLQANNGMSNPTYVLWSEKFPGRKYVVRKKPPGKELPGAHQVDREFRIMHALRKTPVPVPTVHHLCEDQSILGKTFYVMDFLVGRVCEDTDLATWTPNERSRLCADMTRVLASLHDQDYVRLGLKSHGRTGHYGRRQLNTWGKQFERGIPTIEENVAKHEHAELVLQYNDKMRALIKMLESASSDIGDVTTLVHGDFRIGNLMLDPKEPRIIAVLDWEISTLGHPICDLAYMMGPWWIPGEYNLRDLEGMPTEDEMLRAYCRHRNIPMISRGEWRYWKALNAFRYGAICHGVYARGLQGNAGSTKALERWIQTVGSIELGLSILNSPPMSSL